MRASEFLIEYKLKVSKDSDGVAIRATAGGKQLGHAEFFFDEQGRLDPQTVWVDERYHGQGIARDMYDHLKGLGYTIVRSWDQTDAGRGFWNKHRGEDARIWEDELSEISRDRLERYLDRANRQVDTRQERMARARARLNTSYEIYHAETPNKVVDRFKADTPALAQKYYQDYIERYESDVDYDLRLRRSTGIDENVISESRLPKSIEQFLHSLTPSDVGVEEIGPYRIHFEGFTDDCKSSSDYCANPESVYQEVFNDFIQREGGQQPIASGMIGDEDYPVLYSVFLKQVDENFADGKKPGRKGLAKRMGVNCKQSVSKLRKIAKNSSGERARMAHWCANMKAGKKK